MDHDIRIAFITPEAPPFSGGGIATFINNITKGLKEAGVFCEVFAPGNNGKTEITEINNVTCHRISTEDHVTFRKDVVPYFERRHAEKKFTVVESCEIHASLLNLMQNKYSDLKYVTRVQMPVVYQLWLNDYYESRLRKIRYVLGAFRRARWDLGFWNRTDVKRLGNPEYLVCEKSDAIIAPSHSFKQWLQSFWKLQDNSISVIPHLFDFTTIASSINSKNKCNKSDKKIAVLFVGKLNAHKGVINLARAAKNILSTFDNVQFKLVGEDWPVKFKNRNVNTSVILREITGNNERFILMGKMDYVQLHELYAEVDICIFPSLWEAWGYTCSEAMSYGKAVIGSKNGGMADAIEDGKSGLLVDPFDEKEIENKLRLVIEDAQFRETLGSNAKKAINEKLNFHSLVHRNIEFYKNILQH